MFRLLNSYFQSSNPAAAFFSRGSRDTYNIEGGLVTVTGDANVAELTFDVHGDRKQMIKASLTVSQRANLENASFIRFPVTSRTESLISNWNIITTQNNKTIVFSETEDLAFIFENKDGFPFEILRGKVNSLDKLKYFQELDFIMEIQKRGYSSDILEKGRVNSPEAFKLVTANLNAATRALQVVSLEAILHIEHIEIDFPQNNIERCFTRKGGGDSGCKIDGDAPWVGRVQQYFGEFTVQLSRGTQSVVGKFSRSNYEKSFEGMLDTSNVIHFIHKWYVYDHPNQRNKMRLYICPELGEVLTFKGDSAFPVDKINSKIVEHQFFCELALDQFMCKHGLPLNVAIKSPNWSEKKLQFLATYLDKVQNWIDKGISLKTIEQMNENKFGHLLIHYHHTEDALKFMTIHDIFGCQLKEDERNTLGRDKKL